jgi:DNA transformation protein and related proteins
LKRPGSAPGMTGGNRLESLRNLGPQSAVMLREAGIASAEDLRAIGAAAAFARVKFLFPRHATLHLLWALHGALHDLDWRSLDDETKARLKREAGAA